METVHYLLIGAVLLFFLFSYSNNSSNVNNKKTMEAYSILKPLNFKNNDFIKFMQHVNDSILKGIDPKKFGFNTKEEFARSLTSVFCLDRENVENNGLNARLLNKPIHDFIIKNGYNINNLKKYRDVDDYCYVVLDDIYSKTPKDYASLSIPGMKGDEIFNKYKV